MFRVPPLSAFVIAALFGLLLFALHACGVIKEEPQRKKRERIDYRRAH
jgi:hypothetical protein